MMNAWRFLKAIPVTFYATGALCAAMLASVAWHARAVDAADARGYQRAIQNARFDSALYAMADSARARATHKTDTVLRTVTQHATRIRTVTVHDTIRTAFPVVDTLVIESQALAKAVDSLVSAITSERAATKVALLTRDNALMQSRLENARLSAQNAALAKRPTRLQAGAGAVLGAAVGFTYGALR